MAASAQAIIRAALHEVDMDSLADWAWQQYLKSGATDVTTAMLLLQPALEERPEWIARFPGMKALQAKGHAMSPAQYIQLEESYTAAARQAGLPPGFYDSPDDFGKLIANEVSPSEFQERVQNAQAAIYNASPAMKQQIQELYNVGASPGDVTAYFLDPDRAEPLLNRQLAAAKISGAGIDSGYGKLTKVEAERAANVGLTDEAIRSGFETLVKSADTFNPQIGAHDLRDGGIGRDQQLGAAFEGDAAAQAAIEREQQTRKGAFSDRGQFATDKTGVSGLGSAAT